MKPIKLIFISMFLIKTVKNTKVGPHFTLNDTTTCNEFSKFARFNAFSVLSGYWMGFYYWGPTQPTVFIKFTIPTPKQISYLKFLLDEHVKEKINWSGKLLLMNEITNITHLLVEQGDRGQYYMYTPYRDLKPNDYIDIIDIRFKQIVNGRYIGYMFCESASVFLLARIKDIPKKNNIQDEAARLGFKGRGGKSYLYQGHEWMPIPEADEEDFWSTIDMSMFE